MSGRFSHVLNVISENAPFLAQQVRALGQLDWLAEGQAFDIPLSVDPDTALEEARGIAGNVPADINILPQLNRRKKLLIADMDSTIIACECLDELADIAGLKPRVSAITERAMRGEIEFDSALRERVQLLKGLSLSALDRAYRERVRLNPGARAVVATMKAHGARTILVSGGFTYFTARVAPEAGFDDNLANVLLDDGHVLLGTVREPILGREAKLAALEAEVGKLGITSDDALAVGDGANDLDMIQRAGFGVAYHAKQIVADAAGLRIAHGDLRSLLYLQGYRDTEIVER
ncbi:MAG TPA: phosphoserine phosphatase SerB [Rhizomicrobium sp.]|nr:phosphoserine phosphatase SerB [Rhizomicrobium sp.]